MASFDIFLPMLLRFEGGYVDDLVDPGGETNKGVTMATFRECSQCILGLEPTSNNLKALSDAQAGLIYRTLYWDRMNGDNFQLQDLANIVCDFYVNSGTHATRLLQHTLNEMGSSLVEDGAIGTATIHALSILDPIAVYRQYKRGRIAYYTDLGNRYPQLLHGWLNRVNAFPEL